jgi:hypothetical protein
VRLIYRVIKFSDVGLLCLRQRSKILALAANLASRIAYLGKIPVPLDRGIDRIGSAAVWHGQGLGNVVRRHRRRGKTAGANDAADGGNSEESAPRRVDMRGLIHGTSLECFPRIFDAAGIAGNGRPFRPLSLAERIPPGHAEFVVVGHHPGW